VPPARADSQPPATVTTANFRVTAPSTRIARLVADVAERTRKDMALTWLRKELPRRPEPCPIAVTVSHQGSGGATSFDFTGGKVFADMHVEGELDRLLADIVPHEVTHTVLADHFKSPLPRWADEGVALLSESGEEGSRHTQVVRDTLNEGSGLQLKVLFAARDFPRNVMGFFAQSYSVTKFLVERKDCPTFVRFITDGMKDGWEPAAKTHYGFASVNELERAWIAALKATAKSVPPAVEGGPAPPALVHATADDKGQVTIYGPGASWAVVTGYVPREFTVEKGGKPEKQIVYEPMTGYSLGTEGITKHTFRKGEVRATAPDGQPVEERTMLEALSRKPQPVVAVAGGGIDPAFAEVLKPGTLILVLPTPKADAQRKADAQQAFSFWAGFFR
jgi:hypothetical protein